MANISFVVSNLNILMFVMTSVLFVTQDTMGLGQYWSNLAVLDVRHCVLGGYLRKKIVKTDHKALVKLQNTNNKMIETMFIRLSWWKDLVIPFGSIIAHMRRQKWQCGLLFKRKRTGGGSAPSHSLR